MNEFDRVVLRNFGSQIKPSPPISFQSPGNHSDAPLEDFETILGKLVSLMEDDTSVDDLLKFLGAFSRKVTIEQWETAVAVFEHRWAGYTANLLSDDQIVSYGLLDTNTTPGGEVIPHGLFPGDNFCRLLVYPDGSYDRLGEHDVSPTLQSAISDLDITKPILLELIEEEGSATLVDAHQCFTNTNQKYVDRMYLMELISNGLEYPVFKPEQTSVDFDETALDVSDAMTKIYGIETASWVAKPVGVYSPAWVLSGE